MMGPPDERPFAGWQPRDGQNDASGKQHVQQHGTPPIVLAAASRRLRSLEWTALVLAHDLEAALVELDALGLADDETDEELAAWLHDAIDGTLSAHGVAAAT